ncbi:polyprenyl synthetase family protein [Oceanobacillus piezotolerans]|uniref:Polyprenyl synthetase family protein n=1 Tax=Oceanobacillus piezotolerans TaxID=2448030 RepID=A0A498D9K4_9BACI|nr:polyprenyl synthetase family protein [Oceanobacillus piezotolerans]RLL45497.1 polyprenyl synthetase family protein [Oceanobacillus piezotolerans]
MRKQDQEILNTEEVYQHAQGMALIYFHALKQALDNKNYVQPLIKDMETWKEKHIKGRSLLSRLAGRSKSREEKDYHSYIKWLDRTGELDNYLDRSMSYLFIRDLGKALNNPETAQQIEEVVQRLKTQLTKSPNKTKGLETFSTAGLYRYGKKEGIESTMIWLIEKLRKVSSIIPDEMDVEHAQRKLIKIIAGVIMHAEDEMDKDIKPDVRKQKLSEAIRLGYAYGLTYPFIDDLLDSHVLSAKEKEQYSELIHTTLSTGFVPEIKNWEGENREFIESVHRELRDAFLYMKDYQTQDTREIFFDQAYVFFRSQEVDRVKDLADTTYTNEELFIPIILKSASSRLIVRTAISAPKDEGFDSRTFYYGIYNQLADDFTDMFKDLEDGAVTPYTYYLTHHDQRKDLINPFELYWTVIYHLIHEVYDADEKTCEVILNRAINSQKRFKEKVGSPKYKELMSILGDFHPSLNNLIQNLIQKADHINFFDKLLRDHVLRLLRNQRQERETFSDIIEEAREEINRLLPLSTENALQRDSILDAANYSLQSNGKRLRPIVTWVQGIHEYGLNKEELLPLIKSIEYMHTASLIFDDLPAQDNSAFRRGRPTVHEVYNTAIAELTGLFLTQKAVEAQATLDAFDSKIVLKLIHYSAQATAEMCKGQALDLGSEGKQLSLNELHTMVFYKTGLAFEASLVMPAILAGIEDTQISLLKKFAYHAGAAFQIKDDLLDVEGEFNVIGKPTHIDQKNNHSTFVTVLGTEGAKKEMWEHYLRSVEVLEQMQTKTNFLAHFLDYIVIRDH